MRRLILVIIGATLAMFMYYSTPQACAWGHCIGTCVSSASCYGDCVCIKIGGEVLGNCSSIN